MYVGANLRFRVHLLLVLLPVYVATAIFLSQEAERFNTLIHFIAESLQQFELAVKGLTAPTPEHDEMHTAIMNNQVHSQTLHSHLV